MRQAVVSGQQAGAASVGQKPSSNVPSVSTSSQKHVCATLCTTCFPLRKRILMRRFCRKMSVFTACRFVLLRGSALVTLPFAQRKYVDSFRAVRASGVRPGAGGAHVEMTAPQQQQRRRNRGTLSSTPVPITRHTAVSALRSQSTCFRVEASGSAALYTSTGDCSRVSFETHSPRPCAGAASPS